MKKWLAALMVILCMGTAAMAEEVTKVEIDRMYHTDLDSDGTLENWAWANVLTDDGKQVVRLTVTADNGAGSSVMRDCYGFHGCGSGLGCYQADLDGDGVKELLISVRTGEGHPYTTWCLRYKDGEIEEVMFCADSKKEIFKPNCGGEILGVRDGKVVVQDYVNVLGSWIGNRTYEVGDQGRMYAIGGDWCTRDFGAPNDTLEECWERGHCLTLEVETAYRNGEQLGMLMPGDRIVITGTNLRDEASFVTEDGRTGILTIQNKAERVHGWNVRQEIWEGSEEAGGWDYDIIDEYVYFSGIGYGG